MLMKELVVMQAGGVQCKFCRHAGNVPHLSPLSLRSALTLLRNLTKHLIEVRDE